MERFDDSDPLEQMINGDQASEQDVILMETIAYDLLSNMEGVTQLYYTIAEESGGPYAEISMYIDVEYPDDAPNVSVGLIDEDGKPLFRIEFDSEDKVSGINFDERDILGNSISDALEMVILSIEDPDDDQDSKLANQERRLLDQIYGLVKILEDGAIRELEDYSFKVDNFEDDYDSVPDGFRYLVDAKYTSSVQIKEYGTIYEQNSSLTIVSHEATLGRVPEDGPCKLYIEFEDRNLGIGYYFEHDQSDDCDITAQHLSEALNDDELGVVTVTEPKEIDVDEEKLANDAIVRMYKGNLAKLHIDLLTAQLVEAELQNSLPIPE